MSDQGRRIEADCTGCKERITRWSNIYDCTTCGKIMHRRCLRYHNEHAGKVTVYSPIQRHHYEASLAPKEGHRE